MTTVKIRLRASSVGMRKGTSAYQVIHKHAVRKAVTDGFISFADRQIAELKQTGRQCTAERYTTVLNSFRRFMSRRGDIPLDMVDSSLMMRYEAFLQSGGLCPNSISFYMRGLRAIYNRAVGQELVVQRNPFKYVYTGIGKTVKRAVPVKVIRQIRNLDLTLDPVMEMARDMFIFSFYTRGMSFIDMWKSHPHAKRQTATGTSD